MSKVAPGIAVNEVAAASGRGSKLRAAIGWESMTVVDIVGHLQPAGFKGSAQILGESTKVDQPKGECVSICVTPQMTVQQRQMVYRLRGKGLTVAEVARAA